MVHRGRSKETERTERGKSSADAHRDRDRGITFVNGRYWKKERLREDDDHQNEGPGWVRRGAGRGGGGGGRAAGSEGRRIYVAPRRGSARWGRAAQNYHQRHFPKKNKPRAQVGPCRDFQKYRHVSRQSPLGRIWVPRAYLWTA